MMAESGVFETHALANALGFQDQSGTPVQFTFRVAARTGIEPARELPVTVFETAYQTKWIPCQLEVGARFELAEGLSTLFWLATKRLKPLDQPTNESHTT